ncbi:MAG TPA: hypothetical protein VJY39_20115 [Acidisphaera sp.]|nr:hypothetical protein [Acidisphaera sp.]
MSRSFTAAALASAVVVAGLAVAHAQGMLLDYAADRVIQKYKTSTCDELKAARAAGPSLKEKAALDYLRGDEQARVIFINRIAPTVANKMFECGMFP